jgi:dihydrodipicolinate synthase/N-acetylneuraminate lyase
VAVQVSSALELTTFNGWDTAGLHPFLLGGRASIWGAATFTPARCVAVLGAPERGDLSGATEPSTRIVPILEFLGRQ